MSESDYPLGPLQQGMLFQAIAHPESGRDVLQLVCDLPEEVDASHLRSAWERLIQRHDGLRVGFRWRELDSPLQRIYPEVQWDLHEEDWRGLDSSAQQMAWADFLRKDRLQGFRLELPPLFRVALLQLQDRQCRMVWTVHHLILDGGSLPVLLRELLDEVDRQVAGERVIHTTAVSCRPHLDWLRKQDPSASAPFWKEYLGELRASTRLDIDLNLPGTPEPISRGDPLRFLTVQGALSEDASRQLSQFADRLGVTVNTMVQAAWGLLLHHYSRESTVVFGITRACRRSTVPGMTEAAGLFTNTLPFRVQVDPGQLTSDWLRQVRDGHVRMREWEHTPLMRIRDWVNLPRTAPLFETLLAFENQTLQEAMDSLGGKWPARRFHLIQQTGFPLTVAVCSGRELSVRITFDPLRFESRSIDRLLGHFLNLLDGIPGQGPCGVVGDLPLLTQAERQAVLVGFNQTQVEYPAHRDLYDLFAEQVRKTPTRTALADSQRTLSYGEVDQQVSRQAARLRRSGVVRGEPVALWSERSVEGVVAILAVLKLGAHYVPLPTDAPVQRLFSMIHDSGVRGVLSVTPPDWLDRVAGLGDLSCSLIATPAEAVEESISPVDPDSLACIHYTSGTSGQPKGACITHRGLVNLVHHRTRRRFQPEDFQVAPLTSPLHFDGSLVQILSPLTTGGTLVICEPVLELGSSTWYPRLTALTGASSLIAELVRRYGPPPSARVIGLGAEATSPDLLERLMASPSLERLVTGYGVTEASCYSTDLVVMDRSGSSGPATPSLEAVTFHSIGRPIANTQIYVLDPRGRPVPPGIRGEIHLGGVGVARGYLNAPDLTAIKFIRDPFQSDPEARLYRTGDWGCWRPDGSLEFHGRMDQQIKLRGYRIEPAEIEAVLSGHPALQQAVVILRDEDPGNARLVAYVVMKQAGASVSPNEIREFARAQLPEYMVPSAVVRMDQIPLNANGKIDRRGLPKPGTELTEGDAERAGPSTPMERRLERIWSSVLQREHVAVDQNFFELGGNSLLALRVFARIETTLGLRLPMESLLRVPTLRALARLLEAGDAVASPEGIVEISPGTGSPERSHPPLFAFPSATGNTLFWQRFVKHLDPSQSLLGVTPPRDAHGLPDYRSLGQLIEHFADQVISRQPDGPLHLLGYSAGAQFAYETAVQLKLRGRDIAFLGLIDTGLLGWRRPPQQRWRMLPSYCVNWWTWARYNSHRSHLRTWHRRWLLSRTPSSAQGDGSRHEVRLQRVADALKALFQGYAARHFEGPITLLRAQCQRPRHFRPPDLGWSQVCPRVEVQIFPRCDHEKIVLEPHVAALAQSLRARLVRLAEGPDSRHVRHATAMNPRIPSEPHNP